MSNFIYNSYRFSAANSKRADTRGQNTGKLTSDGYFGFDCSGFVYYILTNSGYDIGNYLSTGGILNKNKTLTSEAAKWQQTIDKSQILPGDLVYFTGHMGFVISYDANTEIGVFRSSTGSNNEGKGVIDFQFSTKPQIDIQIGPKAQFTWGGSIPFLTATRVTANYIKEQDLWVGPNTQAVPPLASTPALAAFTQNLTSEARWLYEMAEFESGNKSSKINGIGALGLYQMTTLALTEAGYIKNGAWQGKDQIWSKADFVANKDAQTRAALAYADKLRSELKANGVWTTYIGQVIDGRMITEEGLIAASWEQGAGGMKTQLDAIKSGQLAHFKFDTARRLDAFRGLRAPSASSSNLLGSQAVRTVLQTGKAQVTQQEQQGVLTVTFLGFGSDSDDITIQTDGNGKLTSVRSEADNAPASSRSNENILSVQVDTLDLKMDTPGELGRTHDNFGLAVNGPGYGISMAATYLNVGGWSSAIPGSILTGDIRPGNANLSTMREGINGLRGTSFGLSLDDQVLPMNWWGFFASAPYIDPLALDRGGDGVAFHSTVNFDLNVDGIAEPIPWVAAADPLLVMDLNEDGAISDGTELVDLTDADAPLNLLNQDGDGNHVLDQKDDAYWQLQLWVDQDQDGYASPEEFHSLYEEGIVSINLTPVVSDKPIGGANGVKGVVATYDDLHTRTLWDVPLKASQVSAIVKTAYSTGVDKVTSNGQTALMVNTSTGVLVDLGNSGVTQAYGQDGNDTLIGTSGSDWLSGGAGSDKFQGGAGKDLLMIDADDQMADIDGGADVDTVLVVDNRGVLLNLAATHTEVVTGGYGDDVFIGGGADNYFIDGAAGDDLIIGGTSDDALSGGSGSDVIQGGKGNDLIRGGRGMDEIFGGDGNDVLDGGRDSDSLSGEAGNDIIIASGGTDVADGGDGTDLIELQGQLEDYKFEKTGNNSWRITDTRNADGSLVTPGQVSDRDGIQQISNVERFSFKRGSLATTLDLGMAAPLPVDDRLSVDTLRSGSYIIDSKSLLANDLDFQSLASPQLSVTWVGDAIGGSVSLTLLGAIVFTPTAGYSGALSFSYTVRDKDSTPNSAPDVAMVNDPSQHGIMKGRALLIPSGSNAPTDPGYANQWYLGAVGAPGAWDAGYTGKGVQVLVLEPPGKFAVSAEVADLNNRDLKPNQAPGFVDTQAHSKHATLVAGVIAAARNGVDGVGVAYDAKLDSISLPGDAVSSLSATLSRMGDYDIVNNSWRYVDAWNDLNSAPQYEENKAVVARAIDAAAMSGRHGLGTIMVYAAGNSRDKGYDSGLSVLTANPYTINVGAINHVADVGTGDAIDKPFSQRGTNILVSAPGSSILSTSTMLQNSDGDTFGNPTEETQGTSLAAPIVSGVVALMLQANPSLSYRDVQTILALTAKKSFGNEAVNGSTWLKNKADDWNGGGMHFSDDYGFGMVDAAAAVRMAQSWTSEVEHMQSTSVNANADAAALADLGTQTLSFAVADHIGVEQAVLSLKLDHSRWSDLVVTLTSPTGTVSTLLNRPCYVSDTNAQANPIGELTFDQDIMSTQFRGEDAAGTWTVTIKDAAAGNAGSGTITGSLNIVGTDSTGIKRYTLTDEYAGGWTITPSTTQTTELNGSAMTHSLRVNLNGGTSTANGLSLTVQAGIDRAIGGLADDWLSGSNGDETLIGGAGNDTLLGNEGQDELQGGIGDDSLDGGGGSDLLAGGAGNNTLTGGAGADIFLIDADAGGTTIIKDFNTTAGGDTLRIRTQATLPLAWASITQSLAEGKLTLSVGTSTVILEGVTSALTRKQLISMGATDELPRDSSGHYTPGNVVYVEAKGNAKLIPEQVTFVGNTSNPEEYSNKRLTYLGPSGTIGSGWYRVEEVTPAHYDLVDVQWRGGTGSDDRLIAGLAIPPAPDNIDEQTWTSVVQSLGRPVFMGYGGDDELIGDDRNEFLVGGANNDTLTGNKGDDYLSGGFGADQFIFNVGDGNDTITSGEPNSSPAPGPYGINHGGLTTSADELERQYRLLSQASTRSALDATDQLVFHTSASTFQASTSFSSQDKNSFTASTKLTYGGGGDSVSFNTIYTPTRLGASNAISVFNAQFDSGQSQSKVLDGKTITDGADAIEQVKYGSKAINTLGGNDIIFALQNSGLTIDAGSGDDTVYALEGSNLLRGGDGDDRIEVTAATTAVSADTLWGGQGRDTLRAGNAGALLYGDYSDGTASLSGASYADLLEGGAGKDVMYGGYDADTLRGLSGDDSLMGDAGNDILSGGLGKDTLYGGDDDDALSGDEDNDELHGGNGVDNLVGGMGNDLLYGDAGNDVLIGGEGDDTLDGGSGDDYFDSGAGHDTINLTQASGNDTVANATGWDVLKITDASSVDSLRLQLIDNGAGVKISWGGGANSVTYTGNYNLETQVWLGQGDNPLKVTLRDIFNGKGLRPDASFQFLGQYDLAAPGNTNQIATLIGDSNGDHLFGGPRLGVEETPADNGTRYGDNDAAYWYVLGRDGPDSVAGGLSGAVLDAGAGDDSVRASNGMMITRDTFHGGEDTLIMPEGMMPETLRFTRIANPLQVTSGYTSSSEGPSDPLAAAPMMPIEQLLPTPSFKTDTGQNGQLPEDVAWTAMRYQQNHTQHYDTLRIQSLDGKYTVDLVGYFDSSIWENNIKNMVFTTVFDADGKSKSYAIDDLIHENTPDAKYKWKHSPTSTSDDFSIYSGPLGYTIYSPIKEGSGIIGGEVGSRLTGLAKIIQVSTYTNPTYYNSTQTDSAIVNISDYLSYRGNADYLDAYFLTPDQQGTRRILPQLPGNDLTYPSSTYASPYPTFKSFDLTTLALPDYIMGFGGNDTIWAGGCYIENHASGGGFTRESLKEARNEFPSTNVLSSSSSGFGQQDQVNGGQGDDTYEYHKGDCGLQIIAIDEINGGAEGIDTLDLSWLTSTDAQCNFGPGGAGSVTFGDHQVWGDTGAKDTHGDAIYGSITASATISIEAGRNGHLQVDRIQFADKIVDVKSLINSTQTASDQRTYQEEKRDYTVVNSDVQKAVDDRMSRIANPVAPQTPVLNGTPKGDFLTVPLQGVAQGWEGSDIYFINSNTTKFSVVLMDKGDRFCISTGILTPTSAGVNSSDIQNQFVGGSQADATYLNLTYQQWKDLKVRPYENISSTVRSTYPANTTFQWGKLTPKANSTEYSLADWQNANGTFDDISDLLLTWTTTDTLGKTLTHSTVLVGWIDATGQSANTTVYNMPARTLSQGDDYSSNGGKVYALAGNDTIASYAHDYVATDSGKYPDYIPTYTYKGTNDELYGGSGNDSLDSGAGDDSLFGGADNDTLVAGFGNDFLDGGTGADILIGGAGNDIYIVDSGDVVIENAGVESLVTKDQTFTSDSGQDEIRGDLDLDLRDQRYANVENVTALGTTAHHLSGTDGANTLMSNGAGCTLEGLKGDDVYYVLNSADQVIEQEGGGNDTIFTSVDIDKLTDNVETLSSKGTGLSLTGNRQDNTIVGDAGNNLLNGGAGADVLQGGAGDDSYIVDSQLDDVIETTGQGRDTVWAMSDYALKATQDIEVLRAYSDQGVSLKGNALAGQQLIGAAGEDTLDGGGGGADSLYGGDGNDTYVLSTTTDVAVESTGAGQDTVQIAYDNTATTAMTLSAGTGPFANIENLVITGAGLFTLRGDTANNKLVGNAADNVLSGGDGNDTLDGGAGADAMTGGAGDDTYVIDNTADTVTELDGGGTDTIVTSVTLPALANTLENLILTGSANLNATGNASANRLVGNSGNNTLLGGSGNDTLLGNEGNDLLNGGLGGDSMEGGTGDDTYIVNDASDVVVERTGEGRDLVKLVNICDYALTDNVEDAMAYIVSAAVHLTGNNLSNILTGSRYNDTLDGGTGIDVLNGGDGNDQISGRGQLNGDANDDVLTGWGTLNGGTGNDTITVYSDPNMGASQLIGGDGDDTLESYEYAGAPSNFLDGGRGNDRLVLAVGDTTVHRKGDGRDTIYGGGVSNTVKLEGFKASDLIVTRQPFSNALILANALDPLNDQIVLMGIGSSAAAPQIQILSDSTPGAYVQWDIASIDAKASQANVLDNTLTGTSGNDVIDGLDGNDFIDGGNGNDQLYGGLGSDTLWAGAGDDNLYGGEGNDVLRAGLGADVLSGGAGDDRFDHSGYGASFDGGTGNDTYRIYDFMGQNFVITDIDATAGNLDSATLYGNPYSTMFNRSGNDLLISHLNAAGSVKIKDWFVGADHHIERIDTTGNSSLSSNVWHSGTITDTAINDLVTAMAGFAPAANQMEIGGGPLRDKITQAWQVVTVDNSWGD